MKLSRLLCVAAALIVVVSRASHATQINTFNRLEIGADDGSFSLRLRGTLHFDADFYESDKHGLPSGSYVRRARIGLSGNLREWFFDLEYDNADQNNSLTEANLARWIGPGRIWIGQFKVFEGLEVITRSSDGFFIERSYLSDLVPNHQVGIGYNGAAGLFGWAGTAYSRRDAEEGPEPVDVGHGLVARGYFLPVFRKGLVTHLGSSYAYEESGREGERERLFPAGRAEAYADGTDDFRFVIFDRRGEEAKITRINFEGLMINGPLSVQGEYMLGDADTDTTPKDGFYLWYAMAGYLLTGEYREYDTKKGQVERPRPQRASGAVEIVGRYQQAVRRSVDNAELTSTEFGVTYYANEMVRFMVNYALVDNALTNDNPKLLSMRAQFDF